MKKKKVGTYEESDLLCNFFQLKILFLKNRMREGQKSSKTRKTRKKRQKSCFFLEKNRKIDLNAFPSNARKFSSGGFSLAKKPTVRQ
jgi:hypothetical protein